MALWRESSDEYCWCLAIFDAPEAAVTLLEIGDGAT